VVAVAAARQATCLKRPGGKRCGCFAEKAAGDDGAVAPRPHAAFAQADVPRASGVAGVTREERRGEERRKRIARVRDEDKNGLQFCF